MALWTFEEVADVLNLSPFSTKKIHNLSIDSRNIAKGDLFIAIKGDQFDGHDYVQMALKNGAAGAIVGKNMPNIDKNRLFIVEDTQKALYDLARAARSRMRGKIMAITGSVGKTGLKEAAAHILQGQGKIHYTEGNLNNHLGLPLSLCRMPRDTDFGIFEIGMNHAGEITPLVQLLRPHIAAITAIAEAHAEFFDGPQDIAKAKAEIFLGFEGEGRVLLPGDDDWADFLMQEAIDAGVSTIVTFGTTTNRNYCARRIELGLEGAKFDVHMGFGSFNENFKCYTKTWGYHYVLTAVAALGLVHLAGGDVHKANERLASFSNPKGRGEITQIPLKNGKNITLVDDAYNANEVSMKAALSVFESSQIPTENRYILLGEMLELGDKSEHAHMALKEHIIGANPQKLWLVGKAMQPLYEALKNDISVSYSEKIDDIMDEVQNDLTNQSWLLVKGSHGSYVYKMVTALKSIDPQS
ncbi:MAG: UDP-N-acetylmuramoyl-tripeptide--D-alanyl-D-alanine ligase [Alphaproteobacteria bacterium]